MASMWDVGGGDEARRPARPQNPFAYGSGGMPPVQNAGLPGGTAGPNPPPTTPAPTPTPIPAPRPTPGSFAGFDLSKLQDPNHVKTSPKYAFASIAQHYANSPDQLGAMFAELQKQFPDFFGNWGITGKDTIGWNGQGTLNPAFDGFRGFDVEQASSENGPWAWQPLGGSDPFTAAAAPAPPARDPFASLPSWLTDGLSADDLIRLTYNSYLGRDPVGDMAHSTFGAYDPRLLDTLASIVQSAEAQQYRTAHQDAPPPPAPSWSSSLGYPGGRDAVSRTLQMLSMKLPQIAQTQTAPTDPLLQWIYALLGLG